MQDAETPPAAAASAAAAGYSSVDSDDLSSSSSSSSSSSTDERNVRPARLTIGDLNGNSIVSPGQAYINADFRVRHRIMTFAAVPEARLINRCKLMWQHQRWQQLESLLPLTSFEHYRAARLRQIAAIRRAAATYVADAAYMYMHPTDDDRARGTHRFHLLPPSRQPLPREPVPDAPVIRTAPIGLSSSEDSQDESDVGEDADDEGEEESHGDEEESDSEEEHAGEEEHGSEEAEEESDQWQAGEAPNASTSRHCDSDYSSSSSEDFLPSR